MFNIQEVEDRLYKAQEILRTTNILEDEKAKNILWSTAADILMDTAKMLKPEEGGDEDE